MTIVDKYGGSSVAHPDFIDIVKGIGSDRIVISAVGKTSEFTTKITDDLEGAAHGYDSDFIKNIMARYSHLGTERTRNNLAKELERRLDLKSSINEEFPSDAYMALLMAFGEYTSGTLAAESLDFEFIDPKELFLMSPSYSYNLDEKIPNYLDGIILPESEAMTKKALQGKKNFVIPGFYGYTKDNQIVVLDRGGSDTTATNVAAAIDADLCRIFTNSPIYVVNPRFFPKDYNINIIKEITHPEARTVSLSGFGILHPSALIPVGEKGIETHVLSTTNPNGPKTCIVSERVSTYPIVGIAYTDVYTFYVYKMGLNDMRGIFADITNMFREKGISILGAPVGHDSITFVVEESKVPKEKEKRDELFKIIQKEIRDVVGKSEKPIEIKENFGCLAFAGQGIEDDPFILIDILKSLQKENIPYRFLTNGSERESIIYGIERNQAVIANKRLYDDLLKDNPQ